MIAFYQRFKERGKNGKVIVRAIMRKLVHLIFGVLKSGKMYDPNYRQSPLDKNGIYYCWVELINKMTTCKRVIR